MVGSIRIVLSLVISVVLNNFVHTINTASNHADRSDLQIQYLSLFNDSVNTTTNYNLPVLNLNEIKELCSRDDFFYSMNPAYMKAVAVLENIFAGTQTTDEFIQLAKSLRDREEIHPKVWYIAITKFTYSHPELQKLQRLSPLEAVPDLFINSRVLSRARNLEKQTIIPDQCISIDETYGLDNGYENALWYFREDIMLNSHHWFWHLVYPLSPTIRPDRMGELFYYVHQYIMARYNTERFTNSMSRTTAFVMAKDAPIDEGYIANLQDERSGRPWSDRPPFAKFSDIVNLSNSTVDGNGKPFRGVLIEEMMLKTRDRIYEAIDSGYLLHENGSRIYIDNDEGIDYLGDVFQAVNSSVNAKYYGEGFFGLHNNGHIVFGRSGDPNFVQNLPPGVMLESGTALRDPIFFRWHEFVNEVFDRHKQRLPPYTPTGGSHPLLWKGIHVRAISVQLDQTDKPINKLETFWIERRFPLSRGLDFTRPQGSSPVFICSKHLDHSNFTYSFVIEREASVTTESATIRVFIAPRFDESGNRFWMEEQRHHFFLLDLFRTKLKVGLNNLTRHSTESTATIPWTQGLYELEQVPQINFSRRQVSFPVPYCGCGFPHHLLLPKGTTQGVQFDLFVMVTNGEEDYVEGSSEYLEDIVSTRPAKEFCRSAPINCGLPDEKYPDAKPMAFPFDRVPYTVVTDDNEERTAATLEEYMTGISNMGAVQVTITHDDTFIASGVK